MKLQVGVSAVVVRGKKFLVIKRARPEEFGREGSWTLPCGRTEHGEGPNKTILREVKEETGLSVKAVKPIDVWSGTSKGAWRIVICFLCKYKGGKVRLSHEHTDYMWVPLGTRSRKIEKWIRHHANLARKELK